MVLCGEQNERFAAVLAVLSAATVVAFALHDRSWPLVGLGLTSVAWLVFVLIPVACLADMVPPTATAMMSNRVAEDRQGLLQGVIASLGSISAVVAPLAVTPLFHAFASADARLYLPGMPYLVAAALMIALFPAFLALNPKRRQG